MLNIQNLRGIVKILYVKISDNFPLEACMGNFANNEDVTTISSIDKDLSKQELNRLETRPLRAMEYAQSKVYFVQVSLLKILISSFVSCSGFYKTADQYADEI